MKKIKDMSVGQISLLALLALLIPMRRICNPTQLNIRICNPTNIESG